MSAWVHSGVAGASLRMGPLSMPGHAGLLAFTLGPAELAVLGLICCSFLIVPIFIYRAGKNAGRAEVMREQLDRESRRPNP